ncbi:MAG: hypothetical protein EOO73_27635 [Myxococcales bacterium]|nr:MAG: hypothetical protein EOO73_27635 [Myxococcales bacterium]
MRSLRLGLGLGISFVVACGNGSGPDGQASSGGSSSNAAGKSGSSGDSGNGNGAAGGSSNVGAAGQGAAGESHGGRVGETEATCKVAEVFADGCTCVLKQDGRLACFGSEKCLGATSGKREAWGNITVPGGVKTLNVGESGHVLAVNQAGVVYYWGGSSELPAVTSARAATGPKAGPIALPGAPVDARLVAIAGNELFCVAGGDNDVSCWFKEGWHQLTLGSGAKLVDLSISDWSVCALDEAGSVTCLDMVGEDCAQLAIDVGGDKVVSIDKGCAITEGHAVYCGMGTAGYNCGAQAELVPDVEATHFGTDGQTWCFLDPSGVVRCRGQGDDGELGNGAALDREGFVKVDLWAGKAKSYALGRQSCAVLEDDRLWCWGHDLPVPGEELALTPRLVPLCSADQEPTSPAPTLVDGFEDLTGTPTGAVLESGTVCDEVPVGTVVYDTNLLDIDYSVCAPTGLLRRAGSATGFYGGQHHVALLTYADVTHPPVEGQQKGFGAVFFNSHSSTTQFSCLSNDGALSGGLTTTRPAVGDQVCSGATLLSLSPLRVRLTFPQRRYAEVELKPVPGTASITMPPSAP